MILSQVIHYPDTNSIEATWVDDDSGKQIRCHSYADVQMQMFRDDIAAFGGDIAEHAELIALVEANTVPYVEPVLTPEEQRERAKQLRAEAVSRITVTVGEKTFDGDEVSQTRMARAIIGMQAAGISAITWVLADNTVTQATQAELTTAMIMAGQAQSAVWVLPS